MKQSNSTFLMVLKGLVSIEQAKIISIPSDFRHKIYLLSFIIFFIGCNSKPNQIVKNNLQNIDSINSKTKVKKEFYEFEARKTLKKLKQLPLSEFTNNIQYIPLETNSECLLSKVNTIEIHDGYIFVLDARTGYYKFDMAGNFVQKIGKIGNGPGEYGMVFYSAILQEYNEIWLYCYPGGKINIYDLETGKFKRNLRFNFQTSGFVEFPSGHITSFISQIGQHPDPFEIAVVDNEGNLIDTIPEGRPPLKKSGAVGYSIYYKHDESLFYMDGFYDTLYHISKDARKRPYASLGLRNEIKANEIEIKNLPHINQYPDFIQVSRILETDKFLFISLKKGIGVYLDLKDQRLLYDKTLQQIVYCNELVNDVDGGLPFWPEYIFNNNELVKVYNASEILIYQEHNSKITSESVAFAKMANKLNENGNPVLMIVKLKN